MLPSTTINRPIMANEHSSHGVSSGHPPTMTTPIPARSPTGMRTPTARVASKASLSDASCPSRAGMSSTSPSTIKANAAVMAVA